MLFALTLGMDSSCCAVSAYDFPSLEHLLHLLHRARACVFLLGSEYHTTNSFFSFWVSFAPSSLSNGMGTSISCFSVSDSSAIVTTQPAFTRPLRRAAAFTI